MDPLAIKPWTELLVQTGLPIVVTAFVGWLAWKYIPKWIDASIDAQVKVPQALDTLNDTLREGLDNVKDVKQAFKHGATASEKLVESFRAKRDIPSDVVFELQKMRAAVDENRDG